MAAAGWKLQPFIHSEVHIAERPFTLSLPGVLVYCILLGPLPLKALSLSMTPEELGMSSRPSRLDFYFDWGTFNPLCSVALPCVRCPNARREKENEQQYERKFMKVLVPPGAS